MGSGVKNEILGHLATSICLFRFPSAYYRSKKPSFIKIGFMYLKRSVFDSRFQCKKPKLNWITSVEK